MEAEESVPPKETCQNLIDEFCMITNTDEALAQFYLQESDWQLQPSINSFFETTKDQDIIPLTKKSTLDNSIEVTFQSMLSRMATTEPPKKFRFITWNLDGLDTHNLKKRTKAVVKILEAEKPDIVFFQEVVPPTYDLLEERLPEYLFIAGGSQNYFTATLLKKTTVHFDNQRIHSFSQTSMGRNILYVESHIGDLKLRLLNTHLESGKEFSNVRIKQLREAIHILSSGNQRDTSILAGDLNLRDKEAFDASIPTKVCDLWEATGSRAECRFTWDLGRNSNKRMPGRSQPQCRFDRVYLHQGEGPKLKTDYFGLEGLSKVAGTQSFPSDHWAIMVHFSISFEQSASVQSTSTTVKTSRPELTDGSSNAIIELDSSHCKCATEVCPTSPKQKSSKKRKRDGDSIITLD